MRRARLKERLASGPPLVLDGATATELQREGVVIDAPLWTNRPLMTEGGLRLLEAIHGRYLEAGAEIITTNTFRTNARALRGAGMDPVRGGRELVGAAVRAATRARERAAAPSEVLIAGCVAPVEDCFQPERVPPDPELRAEHRAQVSNLLAAGVDLILAETMNCIREAKIVVELSKEAGANVFASFVCSDSGDLLSGEPLQQAVAELSGLQPEAILINCTSFEATRLALEKLGSARGQLPLGIYPNIERRPPALQGVHVAEYLQPAHSPEEFGAFVAELARREGLRLIGGCCGSTPAHIAALAGRAAPGSQVPGSTRSQLLKR